ncbi:MAG: nitric-oxide reductase large subunit, partial [FCB group bacterium]|nr:nitric-oxide reductase large subunit [FCB group bacterium]
MPTPSRMVISTLWLQVAIITFAIGFGVLGYLAYRINTDQPPIPAQTVSADGATLYTHDDIMGGQHLFQQYGLMQFGTIFGHGAYLGPDFTAQYLHHASAAMLEAYSPGTETPEARAQVERDFKQNTYDAASDTLTFSAAQAQAFTRKVEFYTAYFGTDQPERELQRPIITNER